jgi:hypothetical protein
VSDGLCDIVRHPCTRSRVGRVEIPASTGRSDLRDNYICLKSVPNRDEIPAKYHVLLDSYELERKGTATKDPLLTLAARHRDIWRAVDADAYVRRLREGFQ